MCIQDIVDNVRSSREHRQRYRDLVRRHQADRRTRELEDLEAARAEQMREQNGDEIILIGGVGQ